MRHPGLTHALDVTAMDDMMMMHGTPWFDSPITLNGDRTYECDFNTTWQCDYQTGYW